MKILQNFSKIFLITISALGIIGFLWVSISYDSKKDLNSLINGAATGYIVILALATTFIAVALFLYYKVRDIIIHPSHLREILIVGSLLIVSVIVGFIFGGNEVIQYGDTNNIIDGFESRLIGAGLIAAIILLITATVYLLIDVIKATIK